MIDQWRELKETITELRDNDGIATQQEVCKFLADYMDVLEKQMIDPVNRVLEIIDERIKALDGRVPTVRFAYQSLRKDVEKLRGEE